jgi:hypothetical protein
LCSCGEVIYTFPGKDFKVCPQCNEVMYVNNENNGEKNEHRPSKPRSEGQDTMGPRR